jgi:hypothetical protein
LKERKIILILLILLLIGYGVAYVSLVERLATHKGLVFTPYFEDSSFNTQVGLNWSSPPNTGWSQVTFPGLNNQTHFIIDNEIGTVGVDFSGQNSGLPSGVSGAGFTVNVPNVSTTNAPIILISHKESSSSSALAISYALRDTYGGWHYSTFFPASSQWTNLTTDAQNVYNGTVTQVEVKFTDDYNPAYSGGFQNSSYSLIGFGQSPTWGIATNAQNVRPAEVVYGNAITLSSPETLKVGTIVSAQRDSSLPISLLAGSYLTVSIKTSSVGVSARVVIWTNSETPNVVLLQTYNDTLWHNVVVPLEDLGLNSQNIYMIELGMVILYNTNNPSISFANLTLATLTS